MGFGVFPWVVPCGFDFFCSLSPIFAVSFFLFVFFFSLLLCCCHAQVSHVVIIFVVVFNMIIAALEIMYSCAHLFWYVAPVIASIISNFPSSAIGRKHATSTCRIFVAYILHPVLAKATVWLIFVHRFPKLFVHHRYSNLIGISIHS